MPSIKNILVSSYLAVVIACIGIISATPAYAAFPVYTIGQGGTNTGSFATSGNGLYYNGTSLATAPTTGAITIPFASSTAISSTGSAFFATSGGKVGIGTSSPYALLSVGNTGGIGFTLATSTFNTTGGINLASGGCFAVSNVCITGGGGGSGTVTSVATDATLTGGPISTTGTLGLNLTHPNTWTGLQQFGGNASSTLLSVFTKTYFGATATSTFDSAGNLAVVSNGLTVGTNQLLVSSGNVGIGTSTPTALLAVNPNGVSGPAFEVGSSTKTYWVTTNGGQSRSCETVFGNTANGADYASSTSMTVDFQNTCHQVLFQIGTAAVTITVQNARPSDTKIFVVSNPTNAAGGTITWSGLVWMGGAAPTQTTTANGGDIYSCDATQATSTTSGSVKIECQPSNGLE